VLPRDPGLVEQRRLPVHGREVDVEHRETDLVEAGERTVGDAEVGCPLRPAVLALPGRRDPVERRV